MLRYADVLLMHAEAENEVNGATGPALESLNLVRKRAGLTDTTIADQDGLRIEIRNERARELCFEGVASARFDPLGHLCFKPCTMQPMRS